jgi:hypothetical protein
MLPTATDRRQRAVSVSVAVVILAVVSLTLQNLAQSLFLFTSIATADADADASNIVADASVGGGGIQELYSTTRSIPRNKSHEVIIKMNHSQPALPYFVVHMGPPKTATTTLQGQLDEWRDVLATDNYMYAGKVLQQQQQQQERRAAQQTDIWRALAGKTCQRDLFAMNMHDMNMQVFPTCWTRFLQSLKQLEGQGIIISDEVLGFLFHRHRRDESGNGDTTLPFSYSYSPVHWSALQEALQGKWQLLVVVGYRRLYEWLPSAKQQADRWTPNKRKLNQWPEGGAGGGKAVEPIMPWILQQDLSVAAAAAASNSTTGTENAASTAMTTATTTIRRHGNIMIKSAAYYFTDQLLHMLQTNPQFQANVTILNIHEAESVRTTFFCHVLTDAHHSCRRSRQSDMLLLSDANAVTEPRSNPQQSLWYDALVTAAAAGSIVDNNNQNGGRPLVDTAVWKRHDVVLQAQAYQEETLNLTAREFAVVCPTATQLGTLLTASLRMEATLLPAFFSSHLGESQHRFAFAQAVARKELCWIDTKAVLQTAAWKTFFAQFGPNSKLQAGA